MAQECAHPACKCVHDEESMIEKGGKYYCSEHCIQEGKVEMRCGCGHDDCKQAKPDYQV